MLTKRLRDGGEQMAPLYFLDKVVYNGCMKADINFEENRFDVEAEDSDCWSIDILLAHINLALLKKFKENNTGWIPSNLGDEEEWNTKLDSMIAAFDYISQEKACVVVPDWVRQGLKDFMEYYFCLWI